MAKANDLTQGKVSSLILKFYFPMLLTNMLQQMYNIADTAIVGKGLGDNALAAVGNMSSLTFLIFGFSMGLANGFSVITAQSFGAKDYSKLRRSVASSAMLCFIIAAALTALSTAFLKPIRTPPAPHRRSYNARRSCIRLLYLRRTYCHYRIQPLLLHTPCTG